MSVILLCYSTHIEIHRDWTMTYPRTGAMMIFFKHTVLVGAGPLGSWELGVMESDKWQACCSRHSLSSATGIIERLGLERIMEAAADVESMPMPDHTKARQRKAMALQVFEQQMWRELMDAVPSLKESASVDDGLSTFNKK